MTARFPTRETYRLPIRDLREGMTIRLPQGGGVVYERIDADPVRVGTRRVTIRSTRVTEDGKPLGASCPRTVQALAVVRVVPVTLGQHVTALLAAHGFTPFADVTTDHADYGVVRIRAPHRITPADRQRTLCDVTRLLWRSQLFAVHSASLVITALDEPGREALRRALTTMHGEVTPASINAVLDETITDRVAAAIITELAASP